MPTQNSKRIVCALQDMGCIQNALPVALQLHNEEYEVAVLINPLEGVAKGKIDTGEVDIGDMPIVDTVTAQDVLLTCLPTWTLKNPEVLPTTVSVVLISENALVSDHRFQQWSERGNLTIVGIPMAGFDVQETGLPAVHAAAEQIAEIADDAFDVFIGKDETVLSVAMPGDAEGCGRMLHTLKIAVRQREKIVIFARTHPKLPPDAFAEVESALADMQAIPLADANRDYGPIEQMALGRHGLFICDWNSTMALQAAAAGVPVGLIPPKNQDPVTWAAQTALLQNGHALPFLGSHPFWNSEQIVPLPIAHDPVSAIAQVLHEQMI